MVGLEWLHPRGRLKLPAIVLSVTDMWCLGSDFHNRLILVERKSKIIHSKLE